MKQQTLLLFKLKKKSLEYKREIALRKDIRGCFGQCFGYRNQRYYYAIYNVSCCTIMFYHG